MASGDYWYKHWRRMAGTNNFQNWVWEMVVPSSTKKHHKNHAVVFSLEQFLPAYSLVESSTPANQSTNFWFSQQTRKDQRCWIPRQIGDKGDSWLRAIQRSNRGSKYLFNRNGLRAVRQPPARVATCSFEISPRQRGFTARNRRAILTTISWIIKDANGNSAMQAL